MGRALNDITRFLHAYILPKLKFELFDLMNNIQEQNGLEVIRRINDEMVNIPEKARTLMTSTFPQCTSDKDGNTVPCKSLKEIPAMI